MQMKKKCENIKLQQQKKIFLKAKNEKDKNCGGRGGGDGPWIDQSKILITKLKVKDGSESQERGKKLQIENK